MTNFIHAYKGIIVNLDHVVSVAHDASGFASMGGEKKSVTINLANSRSITVTEDNPEYQLWLDFMDRHPRLLSAQDQQRQNIVDGVFNPFVETDKLTAIYSLFNEIPERERLLLCLESEEVGCIRAKGNFIELLVSWQSAVEAIDRIHAYRESLLPGYDIS